MPIFDDTLTAGDYGVALETQYPNWQKHALSGSTLRMLASGYGCDAVSPLAFYWRNAVPPTANYEVVANVAGIPASSPGDGDIECLGPAGRMSTTDQTFYVLYATASRRLKLSKWITGTETILADIALPSSADGHAFRLKLYMNGTTIRGFYSPPASTEWGLMLEATDGDISAIGYGGLLARGYAYQSTIVTTTGAAATDLGSGGGGGGTSGGGGGAGSPCTTTEPQFWMLTTDRLIGRMQSTAQRDGMTDADTATGTAIPDWSYSTGFDFTEQPTEVKGLLVDATDMLQVRLAKTVAGVEPNEGRLLDVTPRLEQDEVYVPGPGNFPAQKFRFEASAPNDVKLRKALWVREPRDRAGG